MPRGQVALRHQALAQQHHAGAPVASVSLRLPLAPRQHQGRLHRGQVLPQPHSEATVGRQFAFPCPPHPRHERGWLVSDEKTPELQGQSLRTRGLSTTSRPMTVPCSVDSFSGGKTNHQRASRADGGATSTVSMLVTTGHDVDANLEGEHGVHKDPLGANGALGSVEGNVDKNARIWGALTLLPEVVAEGAVDPSSPRAR